jgi:xanthine dehydrogenase molybdenum-binding subunit
MRFRLLPEVAEIEVLTGMVDQGAGAHTLIRRVAAAALSVAPERIVVRYGDTDSAPTDPGAGGSRVTHVIGRAALDGGERMRAALEDLAAEAYGWPADQVRLEGDRFSADGESASFEEVAARLAGGSAVEVLGEYAEAPHGHDEGGDFNASVYAVEVSVDAETGAVEVCDAVQVVDVGTVINPLAHQGQLNGGFAFGVGAALIEELPVEEGKVAALSLGEYKLPTQMDMPRLRTILLHTEVGPGPFGAKAVGEVTNSGVAPAIANAVDDAVGARVYALPITAEKVRAQLAGVADRRRADQHDRRIPSRNHPQPAAGLACATPHGGDFHYSRAWTGDVSQRPHPGDVSRRDCRAGPSRAGALGATTRIHPALAGGCTPIEGWTDNACRMI